MALIGLATACSEVTEVATTDLAAVVERDGVPFSVGRTRRVVPERTRRVIERRDRGCRVPGCE